MIDIVLVAAVADNGVIGRDNGLVWRLKSDMLHFRAVTVGKPVVMGRKTYQSIGKPLKGRTTIVISRDPAFTAPGAIVAPHLTAALGVARGDALRRGTGEIMIVGGGEIYRQAMPLATRMELTRVHARPEGDASFPDIDPAAWQETASDARPAGPDDEAPFTFASYRRAPAA